MKMIILVALALVAGTSAFDAAPVLIKILRSEFNKYEKGYQFEFETENGITRSEHGEIKEAFDEDKKPHSVVVVRGTYSYKNSDGKPETINYFADETGYHAEGDSIPKLPSRR
ncbi:Cuticle protein [Operophtera brumata]|uniref:Cuticle protein n=1 Tax=Operophtera brumata TaxID=104452 RepID=A0A0L7LAX7_OPEBR|nr:Cuticle protein [Operophtera brumata]